MICTSCGREVFGEARFCPNCAAPLGASSPKAEASTATVPQVPRRRGKLWHLHTYDWTGICPKCQTPHTYENTRCPNDKSPLVVAFNCWRWNPFVLPMHTAHVRCSGNCGYTGSAVHCTADGVAIASVNLEFQPRLVNIILHNVTFLLLNLISVALVACIGWSCYVFWDAYTHPNLYPQSYLTRWAGFAFLGITLLFAWCRWIWAMSRLRWWPFRRSFDFEATARAAAMRRRG